MTTPEITTEWLLSVGCTFLMACFAGPDIAYFNGREVAFRDYKFFGFGPPKKWELIGKPRFRVKAHSIPTQQT